MVIIIFQVGLISLISLISKKQNFVLQKPYNDVQRFPNAKCEAYKVSHLKHQIPFHLQVNFHFQIRLINRNHYVWNNW